MYTVIYTVMHTVIYTVIHIVIYTVICTPNDSRGLFYWLNRRK